MKSAALALSLLIAPLLAAEDSPRVVWVKAKCALCHGLDGKGQTDTGKKTNTPDLTPTAIEKLSDEQLAAKISSGHRKMPSFHRQLDAAKMKQLVRFLRELGEPSAGR